MIPLLGGRLVGLLGEITKMFLENTVNQNEQFGWIEVICGSMFSGKTEELIRRLKRAQIAQRGRDF